jgi:peptidoglycan/LPS O-acetylase OafA/YrhL
LLRFVCALAVLLFHFQHFLYLGPYDDIEPAMRATFPMFPLLSFAYNNGYWAVQVFWVISGFIFYWRYAGLVSKGAVEFRGFAVRRFSRLYPLHLATLFTVAAGQYIYFSTHGQNFVYANNSTSAFAYHLFFASNWFQWQGLSFNGPVWSVSAEILIYLAFFGVARFFGSNALVAVLAAGICWSLTNIDSVKYFDSVPHSRLIKFLTPNVACGMWFFIGGAAQRVSSGSVALPLSGCVGAVTLALLTFGVIDINYKSLLALSISAVVFFARLSDTPARPLLTRVGFLGNATYSSYLLHFPLQIIIVLCVDALGLSRDWLSTTPAFLAYLGIVIGCSLAVYRWFERPAQDLIRRLCIRGRGSADIVC